MNLSSTLWHLLCIHYHLSMNAPSKRHPGVFVILALFVLVSCTDRRQPKFSPNQFPQSPEPTIDLVAEVQFMAKTTEVLQMAVEGNSLYVTGRPFGFSRWEIGTNPEEPKIIFAASNAIEAFSPYPKFGFWTPDNFAQGGLNILGTSAFMSGAAGMSVIDIAETHAPIEVARFPSEKIDGVQVTRDPNFVYSAMVHHPSLPLIYGFKESDHVYTLAISSQAVSIREKAAYGPTGACCAMGAAVSQTSVLVAMRGSLWTFELGADGRLGTATQIDDLQAVNVVTSANYIYVQHAPAARSAGGVVNPAGIYVFDQAGQPVTFLPISPIRFAVFQDTYVFANMENSKVSIFAIR